MKAIKNLIHSGGKHLYHFVYAQSNARQEVVSYATVGNAIDSVRVAPAE